MSLRILIGHEFPGQRGQARALYIGDSGQALETAKAQDTTSASFTILNNPLGVRKSNPRFDPDAKGNIAEIVADIQLIGVDIGEGEEKVTISVASEEEAEYLRNFVTAAKAACMEIIRIQGILTKSDGQSSEREASFAKALQTHLDEIAALKKQAMDADAEYQSKIAQITDLSSQVSALKTQLEEARKAPSTPSEPEPTPKSKGKPRE
jgi:hypothetical protein